MNCRGWQECSILHAIAILFDLNVPEKGKIQSNWKLLDDMKIGRGRLILLDFLN